MKMEIRFVCIKVLPVLLESLTQSFTHKTTIYEQIDCHVTVTYTMSINVNAITSKMN